MKILVMGKTGSVTEDISEEQEIAQDLSKLGHEVIYQDVNEVKLPELHFDLAFIANNRSTTIEKIRKLQYRGTFVIWWLPDFVDQPVLLSWTGIWQAADLVLIKQYEGLDWFKKNNIKTHYWNFDVACSVFKKDDAEPRLTMYKNAQRAYPESIPVGFAGNWVHDPFRMKFLHSLQKYFPDDLHITTYSVREFDEGQIDGGPSEFKLKNVHHGLFGEWHNRLVAMTKVNLAIDWKISKGFWSPRIARTMAAGGFTLVHYVEGMEEIFHDYVDYFHSLDEAIEKINYWLAHDEERIAFAKRSCEYANTHLRPNVRIKELLEIYENISS